MSAHDLCPYNANQWSSEEYVAAFVGFLSGSCGQQIDDILNELDVTTSYGVRINMLELITFNNPLGTLLLYYPQQVMPHCDQAISVVQNKRMLEGEDTYSMSFKPHAYSRLCSLPLCPETSKPNVSCLRNCDIGRFVSIPGTVIRTGSVKTIEWKHTFECTKCKLKFSVTTDLEQRGILPVPQLCPNEEFPCPGNKFNTIVAETVCRDFQEIKVQEKVHQLDMGSIPRSILVIAMDELADLSKPGDDVEVHGTLMRRWAPVVPEKRCELEMVVVANNLIIANEKQGCTLVNDESKKDFEAFWDQFREEPLRGRNAIVRSICPQLHGLFLPKLTVVLTIIGGVPYLGDGGHHIRGEGHMLMIGDPGLGKSQLLKYGAKLSARSVVTTGIGSTSAGLTTAAAKDNGEWVLEAGALVLADGGVCCIDEFGSLKEQDRTTIHEAMEQQTISVAKAGLVCKLQSRCSVLAACNPKTQSSSSANIGLSSGLSGPLLSRFDVVLVLCDTRDEKRDATIADFVLDGFDMNEAHGRADLWDLEKLQLYLAYTRQHYKPQMTQDAECILQRFYTLARGSREVGAARTTIRMLESLVRLAQAHARLMHHTQVERMDAMVAVWIVEASTASTSDYMPSVLSSESVASPNAFPENPDLAYRKMEMEVLERLGLEETPDGNVTHAEYTRDDVEQIPDLHPMTQKGGLTQTSAPGTQTTGLVWSMFTHGNKRPRDDDDEPDYTTMF